MLGLITTTLNIVPGSAQPVFCIVRKLYKTKFVEGTLLLGVGEVRFVAENYAWICCQVHGQAEGLLL